MKTGRRCVVLGRERKDEPWCPDHFVIICESFENGWRFARGIEEQERAVLDVAGYQAIVVDEEDYDHGSLKPVKPPKGFDFQIPERVTERVPIAKQEDLSTIDNADPEELFKDDLNGL